MIYPILKTGYNNYAFEKRILVVKNYIIAIEETISQEFMIEAENVEKAMEKVEEKYLNGEVVLECGGVTFKQMAVVNPNEEMTEWIEF